MRQLPRPDPLDLFASIPSTVSAREFEFVGGLLGRGSFARLRRARHPSVRDVVALKITDKPAAADSKQHRRGGAIFDAALHAVVERQVLQHVDHPNVIKLFASTQDDRAVYFALEFVAGHDLEWHIRNVAAGSKRFPSSQDENQEQGGRLDHDGGCGGLGPADAWRWAAQILDVLEYLSELGISWRDCKPENVLLDVGRDQVKCVDFGTAKWAPNGRRPVPPTLRARPPPAAPSTAGEGEQRLDIWQHVKECVGTPHYMSPEAVSGGKPHPTDPRSDLWSFGVLLYRMLTGEHLFRPPAMSNMTRTAAATKAAEPSSSPPGPPPMPGSPEPTTSPAAGAAMAAVTAVTAAGYTDFQVMDMVRRRAVCFSDGFGDGPKRELVDRLLSADPSERPSHAEVREALQVMAVRVS